MQRPWTLQYLLPVIFFTFVNSNYFHWFVIFLNDMLQVAGYIRCGAKVHGQRGGLEIGFMHICLLNGRHRC